MSGPSDFDRILNRDQVPQTLSPFELLKLGAALDIYDVGAFRDKSKSEGGLGFKLKLHEKHPDAPLSPVYLNLRTPNNPKPGPLTPAIVDRIGEVLFRLATLHGLEFDAVAGIPNAGDPFAEAFIAAALRAGKQLSLIKLGKTEIGGVRKIEGVLPGDWKVGMKVLLVDDLVTQADTKLEAIGALEAVGFKVTAVMVLVDRDQGGTQEVRKKCPLYTVFTIRDLLMIYLEADRIPQATSDEIEAYVLGNKRKPEEQPEAWRKPPRPDHTRGHHGSK